MNADIIDKLKTRIIGIQQQYGTDFIGDGHVDFNPHDWSGGNFDDCFSQGSSQGIYDACEMILFDISDLLKEQGECIE